MQYKRIYMASGATLIGLFTILLSIGLQITSDGDKNCAGSIDDPCMSFITVYNPTPKNIYIYNKEGAKFGFSPDIKEYFFYTKDGRCSASGSCACTSDVDGRKVGFKGWRCTDFTNETKPSKDRKYVFRWGAYSVREHLLVGYKNNPDDRVKWSLGLPGDELDPIWESPSAGSVNYTLLLDGLSQARKYEINTTANITLTTNSSGTIFCLEVDGRLENCSAGGFSYMWGVKAVQRYLNDSSNPDGVLALNVTSTKVLGVVLDSSSDVVSAYVNLTGFATGGFYPADVGIDFDGDGSSDTVYPAKIVGGKALYDTFFVSGVGYSAYNLTFIRGGSSSVILTVNPYDFRAFNLSFVIKGFDIDAGNDFSYTEYFNDSRDAFNLVAGNGTGYYDNFENNYTSTSGRWSQTVDGNGYWSDDDDGFTSGDADDAYLLMDVHGSYGCTESDDHCVSSTILKSTDLDVRNVSYIHVYWKQQYASDLVGKATGIFRICDDTTCAQVSEKHNLNAIYTSPTTVYENLTVRRSSTDDSSWDILSDGVSVGSVLTSVLDPTEAWRFRFEGICQYSKFGIVPDYRCSTEVRIYSIIIGGAFADKSFSSVYYSGNSTVTSDSLDTAPGNIVAATLTADSFVPSNASVSYFLSNDGGSTWESVVNGQRHVFSSSSNDLRYRVNISTNDGNVSPIVYKVAVDIASASIHNVSVLLGGSTTDDYSYTGVLNSSTSPQFVTFPDVDGLQAYADDYCGSQDTYPVECDIPIYVSSESGGLVEVSNFSFEQLINPFPLNLSVLEDCDSCSVGLVLITNGTLQFSDLRVDVLGSKNVTVLAYVQDEKSTNDSLTVQARYSKFNISLPDGIYWWDFFASSNDARNVSPFGQTDTVPIWNVTSQAYDDSLDFYVKVNETLNLCLSIIIGNVSDSSNISFPLTYCYDEYANNTVCAGSNGTYSFTGSWGGGVSDLVDGSTSTFSAVSGGGSANMYINYTKPEKAKASSLWFTSFNGSVRTRNFTIPSACWDYSGDYLLLRVESYAPPSRGFWWCYNGSSYQLVPNSTSDFQIREEGVYWAFEEVPVSSTKVFSNLSVGASIGLWSYLNLYSCPSSFYVPWFHFSAICSDCVKTSDFDQSNWVLE